MRKFKRLTGIADRHYENAKRAERRGQSKRAERLYELANTYYKKANAELEAARKAGQKHRPKSNTWRNYQSRKL